MAMIQLSTISPASISQIIQPGPATRPGQLTALGPRVLRREGNVVGFIDPDIKSRSTATTPIIA
jgi:hypothetical protein